jgi:hypothetical protein
MASGQSRRPISQRRCAPWLIRRDGAGNTLQHDPRSPQASPSAEHAASAKPGRQHWQARTGARSMWQRCARAVADPGSPKLPRGRDDEPNNAWHAERHGYDPTALRRAQAGTDHACDCAGPALLPARGTGPARARPQLLLSLGLGPTAADFERRRADLRSERASLFGGSIEPEAREARQRHGRPPASFAARSLCAPHPPARGLAALLAHRRSQGQLSCQTAGSPDRLSSDPTRATQSPHSHTPRAISAGLHVRI